MNRWGRFISLAGRCTPCPPHAPPSRGHVADIRRSRDASDRSRSRQAHHPVRPHNLRIDPLDDTVSANADAQVDPRAHPLISPRGDPRQSGSPDFRGVDNSPGPVYFSYHIFLFFSHEKKPVHPSKARQKTGRITPSDTSTPRVKCSPLASPMESTMANRRDK